MKGKTQKQVLKGILSGRSTRESVLYPGPRYQINIVEFGEEVPPVRPGEKVYVIDFTDN